MWCDLSVFFVIWDKHRGGEVVSILRPSVCIKYQVVRIIDYVELWVSREFILIYFEQSIR